MFTRRKPTRFSFDRLWFENLREAVKWTILVVFRIEFSPNELLPLLNDPNSKIIHRRVHYGVRLGLQY